MKVVYTDEALRDLDEILAFLGQVSVQVAGPVHPGDLIVASGQGDGIGRAELQLRLLKDKKTIQHRVHFVLPVKIGAVEVRSDVPVAAVQKAIDQALTDCRAA